MLGLLRIDKSHWQLHARPTKAREHSQHVLCSCLVYRSARVRPCMILLVMKEMFL